MPARPSRSEAAGSLGDAARFATGRSAPEDEPPGPSSEVASSASRTPSRAAGTAPVSRPRSLPTDGRDDPRPAQGAVAGTQPLAEEELSLLSKRIWAEDWIDRGIEHLGRGEDAAASRALLEALTLQREIDDGLSRPLLNGLHRLGVRAKLTGQPERAEEVFGRAADATAAMLGEWDFATLLFEREYRLLRAAE